MLREAGPVLYCFMPLQSSRRIESLILGSGLPSWLPDLLVVRNPYTNGSYSASDKRTDACHLPDNLLRASEYGSVARTTEQISSLLPFASSTFSPNLRELFVPGVLIGTIVETSGELLNQRDDTISIADQTRNLKQLYESLLAPRDISIESMIRLLANQGHWKQLNAAYYDAAKKAFVTNARQSDIPKAVWEVMVKLISLLVSTVANRILFVMDNKRFGLAYHLEALQGIRSGDIVAGLFGINFPFILRPTGNGRYRMINVARINMWHLGHSFLGNRTYEFAHLYPDFPAAQATQRNHRKENRKDALDITWRDYEHHGMREFVIV
jgi:hypothetical protein